MGSRERAARARRRRPWPPSPRRLPSAGPEPPAPAAPEGALAAERMREAAYLASLGSAFPMSADASGALLQPVEAAGWTVLVSLAASFPERCPDGSPAAKAYLVEPPGELVAAACGQRPRGAFRLGLDAEGNAYIAAPPRARRPGETCSEALVRAVEEAARELGPLAPQAQAPGAAACTRVVLSSRAYAQIRCEAWARDPDETGGLLLGHYEGGVWCVVEASDPGWEGRALFRRTYHEGDPVYENHVCSVASRAYRHPLVFLGMWHRHPGSMDTFSSIDDETNLKYADACGNGCVSGLVNFDPDFRLTFYHARRGPGGRAAYTRVPVDVGDAFVPNPEMLAPASPDDLAARLRGAR